MIRLLVFPWLVVKPCFAHIFETFEHLLGTKIAVRFALSVVSLLVAWHIYTPIHELMHVAGCLLGGGTVSELALSPQYGAHFLKHIFPFIVPESEYAGQLSGFSTPNYWVYAMTDFFPYLLSLPGVVLMELSRRKNWVWLFGPALILILVPLTSIPGDFYELASLVTTQIGEAMTPAAAQGYLISDDVFKLIGTLREQGSLNAVNGLLVLLGILFGAYLALVTIAIEWVIARKWLPGFPPAAQEKSSAAPDQAASQETPNSAANP